MSEDKHFENDPERTLITLEQLSQTIEVMTSVVNRLRQHLSEQLHAQMEEQNAKLEESDKQQANAELSETKQEQVETKTEPETKTEQQQVNATPAKKESFVVEIRQHDNDPTRKNGKTLH